jgi:hypothetical protein
VRRRPGGYAAWATIHGLSVGVSLCQLDLGLHVALVCLEQHLHEGGGQAGTRLGLHNLGVSVGACAWGSEWGRVRVRGIYFLLSTIWL